MLAAGLLAKKAVEAGLTRKPWVKTSLAPGSKVVTDYLERAGLIEPLEQLGFNLVGYGCTTCIGNSGPLPEEVSQAIDERDLVVCSVLSGNRNFEGRIHPEVRAELPRLAAAGRRLRAGRPDGHRLERPARQGAAAGRRLPARHLAHPEGGQRRDRAVGRVGHVPQAATARCSRATRTGTALEVPEGDLYEWDDDSTYVKQPAVLRRHGRRAARAASSRSTGARVARAARRQRHHRPHLAGRLHQGGPPAGQVPDRARRRAGATSTPTARGAATTR